MGRKTVVVNSEIMGGGPSDLGATLMAAFLRNLATAAWHPETIIFYNSGVRLLLVDSAAADALRRLRDRGVDLVACGTCVAYFDLPRDRLLGRVGNMQEIVAIMGESDTVVTV